jgi:hypothetical protein
VISPARYDAAVAAETTAVAEKSRRRRADPIRATGFVDTLSLVAICHENLCSEVGTTYR